MSIDIYFTPRFQPLIEIAYASCASSGRTDLTKPFVESFPSGFLTEKAKFDAALEEEEHLSLGELGAKLVTSMAYNDGAQEIQVLHANLANASATLRRIHARLQPLLLFFIDAASLIDQDDPNWDILLAVEKSSSENAGGMPPRILGFATLYNFWVFPDRQRMRISQVLVLPPYQGTGVGNLLVESAYKIADERNVIDITMEDPTEDMQRLRDRIDLQRMLQLTWTHEAVLGALNRVLEDVGKGTATQNGQAIRNQLKASAELLQHLRKDLRLSRQQAKRMWESLLYKVALDLGTDAIAAVEKFLHSTLESQVLEAKQESQDKKMITTEGQGFMLFKQKSKYNGFKNASADQTTLPVEEMSEEKQKAALLEAVNERIEELNRLCCPSRGLDRGEEDGGEEE